MVYFEDNPLLQGWGSKELWWQNSKTFYSNTLLSLKKNTCMNLSCQGEMMGHLWSAFLSSTELAGYLSPSRGDSRLSPATVVRIAWHCGRVLGQARTLGRLSNSVEPCFPHWCILPHPSAPLFLSTLHTTAAAPVQSVYLRRRGNSL